MRKQGEEKRYGEERMIGVEEGEGGGVVLGDSGSGNLNLGRRRGGKVDRSVGKGNKGEEDRRGRDEEERGRGGETERRGGVLGDAGSENPGRRPRVPTSGS